MDEKSLEREGAILVANTGGDMVVEYLSANLAMILLSLFGAKSSAFRFKNEEGTTLTMTLIIQALAAQHLPELVCDMVCIVAESRAELPIAAYLRGQVAAVAKKGNLRRAFPIGIG